MTAPVMRNARTTPGSQSTRRQLDELDALLQRMLDLPVRPSEAEDDHDETSQSPPPETRGYKTPTPAPVAAPRPANPRYVEPPRPAAPPPTPGRGYPSAYMVVETTAPDFSDLMEQPTIAPPARTAQPPVYDHAAEQAAREEAELARLRARLEQEGDWVPLKSSWQPSEQTWKPLAATWEQKHPDAPPVPASAMSAPPVYSPPAHGRMTHPEAETPFPTLSATNIPVVGGPPPLTPATGRELHRSPASMDMPWSLGGGESGTFPRYDNPASWSNLPAQEVIPPTPASLVPPASLPLPEPAPASAPVYHRPMHHLPWVWFNAAFDVCLWPLGPIGSALKGRGGRTFLGTVGLLCMAAAAALAVAEGYGYGFR